MSKKHDDVEFLLVFLFFNFQLFDGPCFEIRMWFKNENHTVNRIDRRETLIVSRWEIISSIFFQFDIRTKTRDEIVPLKIQSKWFVIMINFRNRINVRRSSLEMFVFSVFVELQLLLIRAQPWMNDEQKTKNKGNRHHSFIQKEKTLRWCRFRFFVRLQNFSHFIGSIWRPLRFKRFIFFVFVLTKRKC